METPSLQRADKAELIDRAGPWKTVEQVELATAERVDFWKTRRLHEAWGYLRPAEFEAAYHANRGGDRRRIPTVRVSTEPSAVHYLLPTRPLALQPGWRGAT